MPSVKVCACLKENEIKNCLIYVKYSLCLSLHSAIIAFSLFPSIFPLYSLFISNCRTVSSFGAVCMLSTKDPFYFFSAILVFRTRKLFQKGPIQFKMDLNNEWKTANRRTIYNIPLAKNRSFACIDKIFVCLVAQMHCN